MRRCCSTRRCISCGYDLSLDDIKQFRQWGSKTPGPSGSRPHRRRRDHDGPARPGDLQRGRHGVRRATSRGDVQSRRPRDRRPLHLVHRERRRPDGGDLPRGRFVRGIPETRQADRLLRQQPHHDRRRHRHLVHATTPPNASKRTAGTCSTSPTSTISTRSTARSISPSPRRTARR